MDREDGGVGPAQGHDSEQPRPRPHHETIVPTPRWVHYSLRASAAAEDGAHSNWKRTFAASGGWTRSPFHRSSGPVRDGMEGLLPIGGLRGRARIARDGVHWRW